MRPSLSKAEKKSSEAGKIPSQNLLILLRSMVTVGGWVVFNKTKDQPKLVNRPS